MKLLLLILLYGAALNCPAQTPFWDLYRTGHVDEAKALIIKNPKLVNEHATDLHSTPLHFAAGEGTPDIVLFLIQQGADVNAKEYNNFTPLHIVNTAEKAKLLLQHGADASLKDAWGNTPLQKAAETAYLHPPEQGYPDAALCVAMLEVGVKLDIISALFLGKRDEVIKMVTADPGLVHENEKATNLWHNVTPLGIAAERGDTEIVELFLKNGAPVDGASRTPMSQTMTPLGNALAKDHLEVAEILLKAGASLDSISMEWIDKQPDPLLKELIHRHADERKK